MTAATATGRREKIAAWLNLQQAYRVVETALDDALRSAAGLSWPEYEVLFRLNIAAGRPLRMNQIAAQLLAGPSSITRIADRLDRDGLISRETPPDNRRVVRVRLTDQGRQVLAHADQAFLTALDRSFSSHLPAPDVSVLRRILKTVLEGNDAWDAARCDPGLGPGQPERPTGS